VRRPLTGFGRALRLLRIDLGWTARDLATGLAVTPAYVSAIEHSRKPATPELIARIVAWGELDADQADSLYAAYAVESQTHLRVPEGLSPSGRESAVMLFRHDAALTDADHRAIQDLIRDRIGSRGTR
jgi:HTH-type transcriptional regulator, competence development regulator